MHLLQELLKFILWNKYILAARVKQIQVVLKTDLLSRLLCFYLLHNVLHLGPGLDYLNAPTI